MTVGNGLKNLQRSDTKCWGQGRQCGRSNNILCSRRTCIWGIDKIRTEREREAQMNMLYSNSNDYKKATTTTFSKVYKVTLYSDSLGATALYAIYTNGPNFGCPKGQCEYVHNTLVFDRMYSKTSITALLLYSSWSDCIISFIAKSWSFLTFYYSAVVLIFIMLVFIIVSFQNDLCKLWNQHSNKKTDECM